MQAAGATPENIERELAKLPPDEAPDLLELGEDDEGPAIGLFLAMDTQWRTAGMTGVLLGLDYAAIAPTAAMLDVELTPNVFADLRLMEAETLKVDRERRAARR